MCWNNSPSVVIFFHEHSRLSCWHVRVDSANFTTIIWVTDSKLISFINKTHMKRWKTLPFPNNMHRIETTKFTAFISILQININVYLKIFMNKIYAFHSVKKKNLSVLLFSSFWQHVVGLRTSIRVSCAFCSTVNILISFSWFRLFRKKREQSGYLSHGHNCQWTIPLIASGCHMFIKSSTDFVVLILFAKWSVDFQVTGFDFQMVNNLSIHGRKQWSIHKSDEKKNENKFKSALARSVYYAPTLTAIELAKQYLTQQQWARSLSVTTSIKTTHCTVLIQMNWPNRRHWILIKRPMRVL